MYQYLKRILHKLLVRAITGLKDYEKYLDLQSNHVVVFDVHAACEEFHLV